MKTIAAQIHPDRYQKVKDIILSLEQGQYQKASLLSEALFKAIPTNPSAPADIQTLFFLESINQRLDEHAPEVGNLYLMPDEGQQIKMFNFMAEKFPLVRLSQEIVNAAYQADMQGASEVIMIDIGIGSGQQVARLIEQAAHQGVKPEQYTVIGIEPAAQSLAAAKATLENLARQLQINLHFVDIPKTLEELSESEWQQLANITGNNKAKRFINASFALHHVLPIQFREELFQRLKNLKPSILAIIEPYADYLTNRLSERFDNAWHHYGLTFSAIDQIDAAIEEKSAVKKVFFSREIQDVLSEDQKRIEQFETGEMWAKRLSDAGFSLSSAEQAKLDLSVCPFITFTQNNNYAALNVEGFPIISILIGR